MARIIAGTRHQYSAMLFGIACSIKSPNQPPPAVVPMPSPDLRRSANAMASDERETDLITATPWAERWTDITQVTPSQLIAAIPKTEPMGTARAVVVVIILIILTLTIIEVLFDGVSVIGRTRQRHRSR